MRILLTLVGLILISQESQAQFFGGTGDGYDQDVARNSRNVFHGGTSDGSDFATFKNERNIFKGGSQDGSDVDGYVNTRNIFVGGGQDGYTKADFTLDFVWTGMANSDWNNTANWSTNLIPTITRHVIIPASALRFPSLFENLISIGQNPNNGDYLCKSISINGDAELILKPSTRLENYGEMEIKGTIYVLNSALEAMQNLSGAQITIFNTGSLLIAN